jgi:hypothetical protein
MRLFAVVPVNCSRLQPNPRDRFRATRPLFIINFNLHARHFTRPGWTNAVQPKLFFPRRLKIFARPQFPLGQFIRATREIRGSNPLRLRERHLPALDNQLKKPAS